MIDHAHLRIKKYKKEINVLNNMSHFSETEFILSEFIYFYDSIRIRHNLLNSLSQTFGRTENRSSLERDS